MTASQKAWELGLKLHQLTHEFRLLRSNIQRCRGRSPELVAARDQSSAVVGRLTALLDSMGGPSPEYDLFVDASRDSPLYPFPLDGPERAKDVSGGLPVTLKTARESAGLSVPDLARKSGLSDDVLRQYESGTRRPTWDSVQKIATALGVPTDAFRDSTGA